MEFSVRSVLPASAYQLETERRGMGLVRDDIPTELFLCL